MSVHEKLMADFGQLIRMMDEEEKVYLMDAAGIGAERLEEMIQGSEPSDMELLATTSVLHYMGSENAKDVQDALLWKRTEATRVKLSYLRCLIEASGCTGVDDVLRKYHIFVDGSVLCTDQMSKFLDHLLPDLERIGDAHKISIPVPVVRNMEHMAQIPFMEVPVGVANIARLQQADQLVVRGDEQDRSPMGTFISAFSKFKPDHALVLLTSDPKLANAVSGLNALGIEGDDVLVLKLRRDGTAALWDEPEEPEEEPNLAELFRDAEADVPTCKPETDWERFDDEDPVEVQEEVIVEDELPTEIQLEEVIVEDELPAEIQLEEVIVEDELPVELQLEEVIVEDELPVELQLEEVIVEDELPTEIQLEEVIVEDEPLTTDIPELSLEEDELRQVGAARLDATIHVDALDLEKLLQDEEFLQACEALAGEAAEGEEEMDPEVEEMKQLLQLSSEQDDGDNTVGEDVLKQFMSIDIGDEDDGEDASYEDDDLEQSDDDPLGQMILASLKQNEASDNDTPEDAAIEGVDWIEL